MRIASAEVIPYALSFREPYVTARGALERREMALLILRDEEGLQGLGEAVPLSLRGGADLALVVGELEAIAGLDELDEPLLRRHASQLSAPARCAALTALMDIRGRRAAAEGHAAEGETPPVPCNATLVAGEPGAVAEEAARWAAEGFTTFKLKLGAGDDVGQVRAVREAVGPTARIRLDVNGSWDLELARERVEELAPYGIELIEQPVGSAEDSALLAAATPIPLAGDESIEGREDAERAVARDAFDLASVKLAKVGGPEEAIEIAEVIASYVSSALDGPVGIAAAAQVAATLRETSDRYPDLHHGLATQRLFASTVASVECELRDGMLHLPPGPGLGVEIDETALDAHRL